MPGTTGPVPFAEWAALHEALDELYDDLPPEAKAILDTSRSDAEKARRVADLIESLWG